MLLADSGFHLRPWMLHPYIKPRDGNLPVHCTIFNTYLSSVRVIVEDAIGMLKNRYRYLLTIIREPLPTAVKIITTAMCM